MLPMDAVLKNRKVRVFLSSTFRDMNAERDYLVNYIFPQVEDYCTKRALDFTPIDLRWGITEEESRNSAVLNSCLEEVNNSRPFFIGILGDRYGWSPDIEELENLGPELMKEQDWLLDKVAEGASITEMEIDFGVLRDFEIPYAAFFVRDSKLTALEHKESPDSIQARKLEALKERIRSQKKYPVIEYNSIDFFGEKIKDTLIGMIEREYPVTEFDAEDALVAPHEDKLARLSYVACELKNCLEDFDKWTQSCEKTLVVTGDAGIGTSTALAYFVSRKRKYYAGTDIKIIYFDFESLPSGTKPMDAFFEFMALERNRPKSDEWAIVAIDNASWLSTENINLLTDWIEEQSVNTHIALAVTEGSPAYDSLYFRFRSPRITVHGMNERNRTEFVVNYLRRYGKRLNATQVFKIAAEPKLGNAVIMRLALDSIVAHGNFETLDRHIEETVKNSHLSNKFNTLLRYYHNVFLKTKFIKEYIHGLVAISLCSEGIPESVIMNAFDISQARWSAVRPVIMRFCKGNNDSLQLAMTSWQHDVKMYYPTPLRGMIGKKISDYLLADKKRARQYAQLIAAIYNDIWHLPQSEKEEEDKKAQKEYQKGIKVFSTSYDAVMTCEPGMLDGMLRLYCDEPLVFDKLEKRSVGEKISYFVRLARVLSSFNRNSLASQCYDALAEVLESEQQLDASLYRAYSFFERGRAADALRILKESGLLPEKGFKKFFSKNRKNEIDNVLRLNAMALELKIYCLTGEFVKMQSSIEPLLAQLEMISEKEQRENYEIAFSAIARVLRCMAMFGDSKVLKEVDGIYKELDDRFRLIGLESETTYEYLLGQAILAYYRQDYAGVRYWSYYAMKSANRIYGSRTNNVLILFNSRSYQYCRAANLYAIAEWQQNHRYMDWHGRGYKQRFYDALPDGVTFDIREKNKLDGIDSSVKKMVDMEKIWFLKAIRTIQPAEKQKEIDIEIMKLTNK